MSLTKLPIYTVVPATPGWPYRPYSRTKSTTPPVPVTNPTTPYINSGGIVTGKGCVVYPIFGLTGNDTLGQAYGIVGYYEVCS